jgi:hypothetical protein
MALTEKNQLLIAFKKLYGKSHTNPKFGIFNESIASSIQLGFDKIFGQAVPITPETSLYSVTSGSVEKIKFNLVSIALSAYTSSNGALAGTTIDDEGDTLVGGVHAFKLVLPSDYQTNTINTKVGTLPFLNSITASDTNGTLQLVPPSFGDLYLAEVSSSSGIISGLDVEDYFIDYYAGILFIQDINRTPTAVTAYAYVGDYADEAISKGYKRLRYQVTGLFDVNGHAEITLPTSSLGNASFPTASFDYVTVDVQVKEDDKWTNNILSVQTVVTGATNNVIAVVLDAPALNNTNYYRLVAVNEDPDYFVIS